MKQINLITLIALVVAPAAFAQSDEELIEVVRMSAKENYLNLMVLTVTEPFQTSELSPSDKKRILQQLASDKADCLADTVVEYAALYGVPISELVSSEGAIEIIGNSGRDFTRMHDECIASLGKPPVLTPRVILNND
jgi:hypothetical protein